MVAYGKCKCGLTPSDILLESSTLTQHSDVTADVNFFISLQIVIFYHTQ